MRFDHGHVLFLDVVTVIFVIDAALRERAAGFLELGPGIALELRPADSGAGQRFDDRLIALERAALSQTTAEQRAELLKEGHYS